MPVIKQIGHQEIDSLAKEIQSALDLIKEKYGLEQLKIGSTTFNRYSFSSKIAGQSFNEYKEDYAKYEAEYFAEVNNLPKDFINRRFQSGGRQFTIVRLETKNYKYPIIVRGNEDGLLYKFPIELIREGLQQIALQNHLPET